MRKIQVHQSNVGPVAAKQIECLGGIASCTHQQHVGLRLNQYGQTFTQERIVVYGEDADLTWFHYSIFAAQ